MGTRIASHRYNGAGLDEGGQEEKLNTPASHIPEQHAAEGSRPQLQFEMQDDLGGGVSKIAGNCPTGSPAGTNTEQTEERLEPPAVQNDGQHSCSPESDESGSVAPQLPVPGIYAQDLEALRPPAHNGDTVGQQKVDDDAQGLLFSMQTEKSNRSNKRDSFKLDWPGEDAHHQDLQISDASDTMETTFNINIQSEC